MEKTDSVPSNHFTSIKNLEGQVGNFLQALNQRQQCSLLNDRISNPKDKDKEQVMAMDLRNRKRVEPSREKKDKGVKKKVIQQEHNQEESKKKENYWRRKNEETIIEKGEVNTLKLSFSQLENRKKLDK